MSESTVKEYKARDYVGDWAAGTVGGCVGTLSSQPLDTWKIRKQTNSEVQKLVDILYKEGVRGFYKGLVSPMIGQAAINFIIFGTEGNVQKKIMGSILPPEKYPFWSHFVSGTFSGIIQSFVASPMELIKIQMQQQGVGEARQPRNIAHIVTASPKSKTNGKLYGGPLEKTRMIYQTRGMRGLYRGIAPTLLRDGIGYGIYFAVYGKTKQLLGNVLPTNTGWMLKSSIAGGLAGALTFIPPIYPIDVIKTRMQEDMPKNGKFKYKGILDCAIKVYREGSLPMLLYKGLLPTVLRGFVWSAAAFPAVEGMKMIFETSD